MDAATALGTSGSACLGSRPSVAAGMSPVRSIRSWQGSALHCPGFGSHYGLGQGVHPAASRRQWHKADQQAAQSNSRDLPA